jgi:hypothetical protein
MVMFYLNFTVCPGTRHEVVVYPMILHTASTGTCYAWVCENITGTCSSQLKLQKTGGVGSAVFTYVNFGATQTLAQYYTYINCTLITANRVNTIRIARLEDAIYPN